MVVQTLWGQRMGPLYRSLEHKLEYPKMAAETVREHRAIVSALARRDVRAARCGGTWTRRTSAMSRNGA